MKKGDERKKEILETAEKLFYQKGFEDTSIQNILDEMKLSKGGFYHHFESKLQLLDALCERQLLNNGEKMRAAVRAAEGDAVAQMNALHEWCTVWREDGLEFAGLVFRAAYQGDSIQIRDSLRRVIMAEARPLIREIIHAGVEQKKFYTRYPDEIGELLLQLFANLNDEIAMRLKEGDKEEACVSSILNLLLAYRHAAEMLTGAPYASLVLIDLTRFPVIIKALAEQKRRMDEQRSFRNEE